MPVLEKFSPRKTDSFYAPGQEAEVRKLETNLPWSYSEGSARLVVLQINSFKFGNNGNARC